MSQTPISFLGPWDTDSALPPQSSRNQLEQAAAPEEPWDSPNPVSPCWEVDAFCWPEVVLKLQEVNTESMRRVSQHLAVSNRSGLKVLAVTSGERGVGRSTVSMHLARAASQAGLKVALVDADLQHPSLVDQLQIDAPNSWFQCIRDRLSIDEVAVYSLAENITIFPLTEPQPLSALASQGYRMARFVERLAKDYDLVLLDSCVLTREATSLVGYQTPESLHAAIVVIDAELSANDRLEDACCALKTMGIHSVGVVENFRP
ncbi:MAG: tyrosine-protein kinase family protein [Pirellula sp.]